MPGMHTPRGFVERLSSVRLEDCFNPYSDTCLDHDSPEAAEVRRENLILCLEAAMQTGVDAVWIARDLGYRGGRRTGIPLTDDAHLHDASALFGGIGLKRATLGKGVAERTADVVWRQLLQVGRPVMLWNVFPLHPHERGNGMTNRRHTRPERDVTWAFLIALLEMTRPSMVVAIGRDAQEALTAIDCEVAPVRHPSYGGQSEFERGIREIHGLGGTAAQAVPGYLPFPQQQQTG